MLLVVVLHELALDLFQQLPAVAVSGLAGPEYKHNVRLMATSHLLFDDQTLVVYGRTDHVKELLDKSVAAVSCLLPSGKR